MTLAEILGSLFPGGHEVAVGQDSLILGRGPLRDGMSISVIGVTNRTPLGVEGALKLSGEVLKLIEAGGTQPILVLVDSDSQRMSRRDELLGLNEYLAHLAKALILADRNGHPTVGLLYGHSAAGAFIATALSTRMLVALPGAAPAVMDLPSISRVTKLPIETLQKMAETTPVFAPGLDNLTKTGAVAEIWDPAQPLDAQLAEALRKADGEAADRRDALGAERKGRPKASTVAARVVQEAAGNA
jgi:malonate decarboxylase gamma subunit